MARYSLLEKLAGHNEPEVDGTAIVKLAYAYGQSEPEFDGGAIMKLASAYGQTKQAGVKEKLLSMLGGERKSTGRKAAVAAGAAAAGGLVGSQADKIKEYLSMLLAKPGIPVKKGLGAMLDAGKKSVEMNQKLMNTPIVGDKSTAIIKGKKLADMTMSGADPDKAAEANKYIMSVLDHLKHVVSKVGS